MIITDEKLLRVQCENVLPEEIGQLREKLEYELKHSSIPGIGLAAPQIGINKNMAIVRTNEGNVDLVNCKIKQAYEKFLFEGEGCLSFPDRYENTFRYNEIYVVENAVEPYKFICVGLLAIVIQHELDHLVGRLLPDVAIPKIKTFKKVKPNELCPCGSNKKYKKCCGK